MGSNTTAESKKPAEAGSMVSFRVDTAVFERLKAAAKRRRTSVSAYCRDVVTAEIESRLEEGTADIYRVAFKTLEEIQIVRSILLTSLTVIFHENYKAPKALTKQEQQLPEVEQDRELNDKKRPTAGKVFEEKIEVRKQISRIKALESLKED